MLQTLSVKQYPTTPFIEIDNMDIIFVNEGVGCRRTESVCVTFIDIISSCVRFNIVNHIYVDWWLTTQCT